MTTRRVNESQPKPTRRLVARLERELAEAVRNIDNFRFQLNDVGSLLSLKSDELRQALNERDEARDDRDEAIRRYHEYVHQMKFERDHHESIETKLNQNLRFAINANEELKRTNLQNFDRAQRNSDVAAALACLVAATSTPLEALLKLTDTAIQMGMSEVVVKEIRTALKRGFAAEVDRVMEIATDEFTAPDHGPYFP